MHVTYLVGRPRLADLAVAFAAAALAGVRASGAVRQLVRDRVVIRPVLKLVEEIVASLGAFLLAASVRCLLSDLTVHLGHVVADVDDAGIRCIARSRRVLQATW